LTQPGSSCAISPRNSRSLTIVVGKPSTSTFRRGRGVRGAVGRAATQTQRRGGGSLCINGARYNDNIARRRGEASQRTKPCIYGALSSTT
jgi:hypothetical protein